jgi:hypothetical protein
MNSIEKYTLHLNKWIICSLLNHSRSDCKIVRCIEDSNNLLILGGESDLKSLGSIEIFNL